MTNTATDADTPAQTLTYTLNSTVAGANQPTINTNTGVITWTPDLSQAGTSNVFTTVVTDSGVPPLSAINSFTVIVSPVPAISNVIYTNDGFLLIWSAPTNDIFRVQFSDSLSPMNWQNFSNLVTYAGPVTPTNGLFSFYDDGVEHPFTGLRFYQINLVGVGLPPAPPATKTVPIGGIVVTAIGVDALLHLKGRREYRLIAAFPIMLGLHQVDETFVWWRLQGHVPAGVGTFATWVYLLFAFVVLRALSRARNQRVETIVDEYGNGEPARLM